MKEELSQKLLESLDKVQEYIDATEDFVTEQAPLIAQEIIMLGRLESLWPVICGGTIGLVGLIAAFFLARWAKGSADRGESAELFGVWSVFSITSGAASFAGMMHCLSRVDNMFEPWFAPRVYLLHEIARLL